MPEPLRSVNGRGKIATKRQVPIATKVVKFVVGQRKSVDLWRTSTPTKKSLLGQNPTQNVRGKMAARVQKVHHSILSA